MAKAAKKELTVDDVILEFFASIEEANAAKKALKKANGAANLADSKVGQIGEKLAAMLQKASDRAKKLGVTYHFFHGQPGESAQILINKRGCEMLVMIDPTDPNIKPDVEATYSKAA